MALSGLIGFGIKRLIGIPEAFKDEAIMVNTRFLDQTGLTSASVPEIQEVRGERLWCVSYTVSFDLIYGEGCDEYDIEIEVLLVNGTVLATAELEVEHVVQTGEYSGSWPLRTRGGSNFRGAYLEFEMKFLKSPPHLPKHLDVRIDRAQHILLEGDTKPEPNDQFYVQVLDEKDTSLGRTATRQGAAPEWHEHIEHLYQGERCLVLQCFQICSGGPKKLGEARVDLWSILHNPPNAEKMWIKTGSIIIASDGIRVESPRGQLFVTMRFWDELPDSVELAAAPQAVSLPAAKATRSPGATAVPIPAEVPPEAEDKAGIKPLEDALKEGDKLNAQAAAAARAANQAAADADAVSRENPPNREIDDLANDADSAAKAADLHADRVQELYYDLEKLGPNASKQSVHEVVQQMRQQTDQAKTKEYQAEDAAKAAMRLNCDDLAKKAKGHAAKAVDYANQTEGLADKNPDVPKIRDLANGARVDQSTGLVCARDARAEAKNCKDADTLPRAYAAMKECANMVKDAAQCENDAHEKWKKAHKLANRRRKEAEKQQQEELERQRQRAMDKEAEKAHQRDQQALDDLKARLGEGTRQPHSITENEAYRVANGGLSPQASEVEHPSPGGKGLFNQCCNWDPKNEARTEMMGVEGQTPKTKNGEGNGWPETPPTGDFIMEAETFVGRRRQPWCWCFGCQCCDCCGEC